METIKISVTENEMTVVSCPVVTAGMVGLTVEFQFDPVWEALEKTGVFRVNGKTRDVINIGNAVIVPWELLRAPGCRLYVGVWGSNEEGSVQIPTLWADLGVIQPGADPLKDENANPSLPIWQQLKNEVEQALDGVIAYQSRILDGTVVPVKEGDCL